MPLLLFPFLVLLLATILVHYHCYSHGGDYHDGEIIIISAMITNNSIVAMVIMILLVILLCNTSVRVGVRILYRYMS